MEYSTCIRYGISMIEKVIKKRRMTPEAEIRENLSYWLGRPPEERVAAVDFLRKHVHGCSERLQRSVRIIHRKQG